MLKVHELSWLGQSNAKDAALKMRSRICAHSASSRPAGQERAVPCLDFAEIRTASCCGHLCTLRTCSRALESRCQSETCHPPVFQSDELQLRLPSDRPSGRRVAKRKSTSLAGAAGLVGRYRRTGEGQRVAAIGFKLRQCLRQVRAKYGWWNRRRVQIKFSERGGTATWHATHPWAL